MPKQIWWSPAAENDMEIILTYLQENWNKRIVSKFLSKVDSHLQLIAKDADIFPIIHEKMQIRKCVLTKQNTIYYRVFDNKIEIVRLFDSRQDPKKLIFL
jgi:plasmid stabilization system protein ParE